MVGAIPIGWPGSIGKCRSMFIGHSHWSVIGRFGIMASTWLPNFTMRSDWIQDNLSTLCNNCEMYLSEGSPNTIHTSVSSANDDDIQSSGIKGRQVVVTCNISKQDDWSDSEALSQDVVYSWFRKFYKLQALFVYILDLRNIQGYYLR